MMKAATQASLEKRNFLFFLNAVHHLSIEDSLVGALAGSSSWDEVAKNISAARQKDAFVKSIKKVQLYVHVPYCGRLCSFCHCSKVLLRRRSEIDDYIHSLTRQMMILGPSFKGMDAPTICFGGGTPSILDEEQMTAILDRADQYFPTSRRKILFEVNPASWTASKLSVLSSRGIFRLSIGVQTLDDKVLKDVSRSQTRKKVLWCLRSARKAGVPHVNVDMMAGLPGQTVKGFVKDLKIFIDEGASIVHVHPYCSSTLKELCAPGESPAVFFKRRDAMMKEAAEMLGKTGFRRNGLGAYTLHQEGEDHQEEAYSRLEAAVAAFGPSAKGQVPGALFYRVSDSKSMNDLPSIDAANQNLHYAMAHYAVNAMINGLDEKDFLKRFGVSMKQGLGEGLDDLKEQGLIDAAKGIWRFSGKWDIRRIREYVVLSRGLFGDKILARLRDKYISKYDPRRDYSDGESLLKAYSNSWLMVLYYKLGV